MYHSAVPFPRAIFLAAALIAAPVLAADDGGPSPREVIKSLGEATLQTGRPRALKNVRLDTGSAVLDLHDGLLYPATAGDGRTVEMVFVGHGTVTLEPPDAIEAGQLELFTGAPRLAERFTEAVLVVARDDAAHSLLDRPAAAQGDPSAARRAAERFAAWREGPERRLMGIDGGLLADALGEPRLEEFFAAGFRGDQLGDFYLLVDPAAEEQLSLGQFVPLEVTTRKKRRISRLIDRQQQRGRLIGVELQDLGSWDTWMSASRRLDGRPAPGLPAFEPRHYRLEVQVEPRSGMLEGRAALELRSTTGGHRVARLALHRDLVVEEVTAGGVALEHFRQGSELHVVLPRPAVIEEVVVVEVRYAGQFFDQGAEKSWALRDGLAWYPHAGSIDRATYDVVLRWPKKLGLVASGRRVEQGQERGFAWERRRLDVASIGFSFEVGRFKIRQGRAGHIRVTAAFDPGLVRLQGDTLHEITNAVVESLRFYEELFGRYPLDEIVVVTVPRDYSQAMLGFVTLSNTMMVDWGLLGSLLGYTDMDRRAVVAHEVAHQWWGHQVGWRGYRDQWISEAMANYASALWTRRRLGDLSVVGPTTGWQQELTALTSDGRTVESVGPLVLGQRLSSSRSGDAYSSIVYRKGAVVLAMLGGLLGEERFLEVLRGVVDRSSGRVLSTEGFLRQIEELASIDLSDFAESFVYATGLPEVYYTYDFTLTSEGRWRVRIVARQKPPLRFRWEVAARGQGFDVLRRRAENGDVKSVKLLVPFQLAFVESVLGVQGRMEIAGPTSELVFETESRPRELWLDSRQEVFGRFYDELLEPKRVLFHQGLELATADDDDAAEESFRAALAASTPLAPGSDEGFEQIRDLADRVTDARVHLELARLALDGGDAEKAAEHLAAATAGLDRTEKGWIAAESALLEARLELARGEQERAFRRLRRDVYKKRRADSVEGCLLLAVAARVTGNAEELDWALRVARRKGADVSALAEPSPGD